MEGAPLPRSGGDLAGGGVVRAILMYRMLAGAGLVYTHVVSCHRLAAPSQVFLGIMNRSDRHSHKRLTRSLQLLMVVGIVWVAFSLGASVFRIPSLHLLDSNTQIQWIPSYQAHTKR